MSWLLSVDENLTRSVSVVGNEAALVKWPVYTLASVPVYLVPIVLLWLFIFKSRSLATKCFLAGVLAWQGLNSTIGSYVYGHYGFRDRPFASEGLTELLFERPIKSFPSDHSALLAAIVCYLWLAGQKKIATWLGGFALLTMLARVMIGFHWVGDTVVGVLLGLVAALTIRWLDKPIESILVKLRLGRRVDESS